MRSFLHFIKYVKYVLTVSEHLKHNYKYPYQTYCLCITLVKNTGISLHTLNLFTKYTCVNKLKQGY
jgi:hypothetical protein